MARLDAEKYHFLDDPKPVLEGLRNCGMRIDLFTFMQRVPETSRKYAYPMEWDNLAVLPVSTFDHWWNHQIKSFQRNRARQAETKGVLIREVPFDETLVKGIWQIYNETPTRQGRRFPHYGKDMQTVYRDEATYLDSSVFIGEFLGEDLIGFIKLVHDETRTQAGLMNILSMNRHRDKAPTNALIAQAVRSCAERNISYLVYSNFAYGEKQASSLSHFKEINGFGRVDLPRYYVPLTGIGRAAFSLGLHRKLVEQIPEPVAAKIRNLREAWYNRKFQSVTEPR
ncbi:MAG: hypothetical protein WBW53_04640 [Terriglobales bacterium]